MKLGLIKWLGSVETSKKKNQNNMPKIQNTTVVTLLEQLKETYPDFIDESTIGTFPGEKYHINVDPTIEPKKNISKTSTSSSTTHILKRNSTKC